MVDEVVDGKPLDPETIEFIEILGWSGSPSRTRTYDLAINSRVLYQLSYRGT